jgi:hypothetical protein
VVTDFEASRGGAAQDVLATKTRWPWGTSVDYLVLGNSTRKSDQNLKRERQVAEEALPRGDSQAALANPDW